MGALNVTGDEALLRSTEHDRDCLEGNGEARCVCPWCKDGNYGVEEERSAGGFLGAEPVQPLPSSSRIFFSTGSFCCPP